jgi:hypothetical protein
VQAWHLAIGSRRTVEDSTGGYGQARGIEWGQTLHLAPVHLDAEGKTNIQARSEP